MSARLSEISAALDRLSVHELQQLVATAQSRLERRETEALLEERSGLEKHCCHCGSTAVRRWGKTRTQLQRWRCRDCGKTFSSATGTLVERVHRRDGMAAVAKDMMDRKPQPCRTLAAALGVDKMTVWRWRTRLLAALGDVGQSGLKGIVEADETYFRESRKGSREWVRHQRAPSRHPRPPRLRWRDYDRHGIPLPRGLSRWQIPVLVTRDRGGATAANRLRSTRLREIALSLTPRLARDAMLCTDAAGVYRTYANRTGRAIEQVNTSLNQRVRANGVYHIQNVNAFHARFKEFMQPFRGPATKYLDGYVAWMLMRDAHAQSPDGANPIFVRAL